MSKLFDFLDLLDGRTLFVACALVTGAFTPVMLVNLRLRKTYPGYDRWAAAELGFSLIFFIQAFRDRLGNFVPIYVGNLLACLAMTMLAEGLCRYTYQRFHRWPVYGFAAAYWLSAVYFYTGHDNLRLRMILLCLYLGVMSVYAARPLLVQPASSQSFGYRVTAGVLLFSALADALRITVLLRDGSTQIALWRPTEVAFVLVNLLFLIGITFSFFVLTNERTENELREANLILLGEVQERAQTEQRLLQEVEKRKQLETQLKKLTKTDDLTHVLNRRGLLEALRHEVQRACRLHHPMSLLLIDLDQFKQINDTHGHSAGDRVLVAFTDACLKRLRVIDVIGRIGGDEFAVILPETELESALSVGEKLRAAVEALVIPLGDQLLRITVSIGAASRAREDFNGVETLIEADRGLYQAKHEGRNCVRTLHTTPPPATGV